MWRDRRTALPAGLALLAVALAVLVIARSAGEPPGGVGAPERPAAGMADDHAMPAAPDRPSTPLDYTVAPGDTLITIAARFGTTIGALMSDNGLTDPDAIFVGQRLRLETIPDGEGPARRLVPDSELVHGPAYTTFDVRAFLEGQDGPLPHTRELVDGTPHGGIEMVERVARDFSVGPRVLLAFVESRSGAITGRVPAGANPADYPAGLEDPARAGPWLQLNWLADRLNGGYYDLTTRGSGRLSLADGTTLAAHPAVNPGSFAVQRALGLQSTADELPARLAAFDAAYRALFGDPWEREVAPRAPAFPELALPWARGERWWITGGPHGGWGDGSAWSALDFVPDDEARGCYLSDAWVTAVADGLVLGDDEGQLLLDLDGDGLRQTGPVVFYLHLAEAGRARPGSRVRRGDRLGHPSCEGGFSTATHLHIARLYDGAWLPAGGTPPMALGGWRARDTSSAYDGRVDHRDGRAREACECRLAGHNDISW